MKPRQLAMATSTGASALANMIEEGLKPHGVIVETDYLFERPGLGTR